MASSSSSDPAATLYDLPISNHGARVRYAIYAKDIHDVVHIVSPNELGGLKGEEYLKRNPQGKMPLLVLADGTALPESEIIVQYLLDAYADRGPSLKPDDAVSRAKAAYVCRHHDMYIASVQGCMYRAMPSTEARATQLAELYKQLCVLESLCSSPEDGSYFLPGTTATHADGAIVPTMCFCFYALPKYFGWPGEHKASLSAFPKLSAWFASCQASDANLKKVADEVTGALGAWDEGGRWETVGAIADVKNTEYKWAYP